MSIFARYMCKEFFKLLMICLLIFICIYFFSILFGRIDNFLEAGVSNRLMLYYFVYNIPLIVFQMLPPAALIGVIVMFSLMKRNNEITAMKASGMSIFRIAQPVVGTSLVLVLASFLLAETVVPYTSSRGNRIWRTEVQKEDPNLFYGHNQIWYRGSDSILWIRHFDQDTRVLTDLTFYFFDDVFQLVKRIDGKSGTWKNGLWEIRDGVLQERGEGEDFRTRKFDVLRLDLPETPETFMREERDPEEMGYWHLRRLAEKVRSEGYDATRYFVDSSLKISFPFIILIMVLIGVPVALSVEKGGAPLAVSLGTGLCFLYLLVLGFARALGYAGVLPPGLSAWLANFVFFLLALFWLMSVDR
ncbi:MAG: LPS export ABC transporter permease LptG [Deltaproteobacteria bacterium]|nr:LPS export ABC transporter permease LptG [Deltaproteobacteria bacterium]